MLLAILSENFYKNRLYFYTWKSTHFLWKYLEPLKLLHQCKLPSNSCLAMRIILTVKKERWTKRSFFISENKKCFTFLQLIVSWFIIQYQISYICADSFTNILSFYRSHKKVTFFNITKHITSLFLEIIMVYLLLYVNVNFYFK